MHGLQTIKRLNVNDEETKSVAQAMADHEAKGDQPSAIELEAIATANAKLEADRRFGQPHYGHNED